MLVIKGITLSLFIPLFLLFFSFPYFTVTSKSLQQIEIWQKVLLYGKIVGLSIIRLKDDKVEERISLKIKALGDEREVKTSLDWIPENDFSFSSLTFTMESANKEGKAEQSKTFLTGKFDRGILNLNLNGVERELKVRPPLFTGSFYIFTIRNMINKGQVRNLKAGSKIVSVPYFDPSILRIDTLEISFAKDEAHGDEGGKKEKLVFVKEFAGIKSYLYFDTNGNFLGEKGAGGIETVYVSKNEALSSKFEDVDVIFSTSVRVEGEYPERREGLSYAIISVEGADDIPSFPPRQVVKRIGGKIYVELRDAHISGGDFKKYLSSEFLIESDDPSIKGLAFEILGGVEKSGNIGSGNIGKGGKVGSVVGAKGAEALSVARAVSDWLYSNIRKTSVLSIPSALEVIKTREGDCNEHAILAVALLRALKIPSRVVFGLVYEKGAFFYHAWVEFFDGRKWIEFDPTWGLFPADILRIRLGVGNVSEWVKVLEYVGKIKISFVSWN